MAGSVQVSPGFAITPSSVKATLPSNYITNFDFLNQYLPDTYEKEFERYGNRSVASFLRAVGAELPSNSDLIKWSEQGRLHTQYTGITASTFTTGQQVFTPNQQQPAARPASDRRQPRLRSCSPLNSSCGSPRWPCPWQAPRSRLAAAASA